MVLLLRFKIAAETAEDKLTKHMILRMLSKFFSWGEPPAAEPCLT